MVNVKFACQLCQSWQPEMRLEYSGTKIIQIFIVTNRFSHSWSRCIFNIRYENWIFIFSSKTLKNPTFSQEVIKSLLAQLNQMKKLFLTGFIVKNQIQKLPLVWNR
jgi:hypothetical protein